MTCGRSKSGRRRNLVLHNVTNHAFSLAQKHSYPSLSGAALSESSMSCNSRRLVPVMLALLPTQQRQCDRLVYHLVVASLLAPKGSAINRVEVIPSPDTRTSAAKTAASQPMLYATVTSTRAVLSRRSVGELERAKCAEREWRSFGRLGGGRGELASSVCGGERTVLALRRSCEAVKMADFDYDYPEVAIGGENEMIAAVVVSDRRTVDEGSEVLEPVSINGLTAVQLCQ